MGRLLVSEIVWTEVKKNLNNIKLAIVPAGSCEQHGPNTTFTTDTDRANEFCKLLGERIKEKALIFPPITYGVSYHHMGFPGTVTLDVKTMIDVFVDIGVSIGKHGINKILFVNGHGGNRVALDAAIQILKNKHGIDAYWSGMGTNIARKTLEEKYGIPKIIGHAWEVETSQCMYLAPWDVSDNLQAGILHEQSAYFKKTFVDGNAAWDWKNDVSENGALGDATQSSYEMGKLMTDIALDYFEKVIDEIILRN